jgi:Methylase involved in ubiquinone/menaquinone biosynthesis
MIELRRETQGADNTQSAYDVLYSDVAVMQHWDSYFHWILKQLKPAPGSSLLDVSCGTGLLMKAAHSYKLNAMGVDFSRVAIEEARKYGPAFLGNGEKLPLPDNSFDYVVNLGSLEHFEDMASGVKEMARVLKPSGQACILVPNTYGLLWTIWHAKNTGEVFADDQPLQRYGSRMQWQRLLENNGLHVERVIGYELAPPKGLRHWWAYLRHPKIHMTKLLLWRFIPVNLASMLVFFCRKG